MPITHPGGSTQTEPDLQRHPYTNEAKERVQFWSTHIQPFTTTMLSLIIVVKFAMALIFIAVIVSSFFTKVTWLDQGCIKSEFLYFNSRSTPCSWWSSEIVPVPNKAVKTVPPIYNRLRRLSNEGKSNGNHKVLTLRLAKVFQYVSHRKVMLILSLVVQKWICLL